MRMMKVLSGLLTVFVVCGPAFADTGTPAPSASEPAAQDASQGADAAAAPVQTSAPAKAAEPAMTLTAEKVDPKQVAQEEEAEVKAAVPKEKKALPLVLQPFEFVITSVVNAICFWKKD